MPLEGGSSIPSSVPIPLVIDLDGTLTPSDMLHECAVKLLTHRPSKLLSIPFWLLRGKARMKSELARVVSIEIDSLPFNEELLNWLREQKGTGRRLVLCTASNERIAGEVAEHVGIFDQVIGSDADFNCAGRNKRDLLESNFGLSGYDYAGNSRMDLEVWRAARRAIVVNASKSTLKRAMETTEVERVFPSTSTSTKVWWNVFRVHQWLKNLLLFVPLLAAHKFSDLGSWVDLLIALAAFSVCSSGVYIANDLLDAESDRRHPRKRNRPFASGAVSFKTGAVLSPLLIIASVAMAFAVGQTFLWCIVLYLVITTLYSLFLKRIPLVDCLTLAALYTIRLIAGAAAVDVALSFWLLAFSTFLFLSLAFLKRVTELQAQASAGNDAAHGRGFLVTDSPILQMMGVTAGYVSALVLALYVNSDAVTRLYRHPEMIWSAVPLMLLWVSWVWLKTERGEMHDDPIVFSVRDKTSLIIGVLMVLIFAAASFQ